MGIKHIQEYMDTLERKLMLGKLSQQKFARLYNQLTLWEVSSYRVEVMGEKPFVDKFIYEDEEYDWDFDEDELEYDDY